MSLGDLTLESEMAKLELMLRNHQARVAARAAKFPMRCTTRHTAGRPVPADPTPFVSTLATTPVPLPADHPLDRVVVSTFLPEYQP